MKIPCDQRRDDELDERRAFRWAFGIFLAVIAIGFLARAAKAALPIEPTAAWVLAEVCGDSEPCQEARREEVLIGVAVVTRLCDEARLSRYACASVIYGAIGESAFQVHPSCGAGIECSLPCDEETRPSLRSACYAACAKAAGRDAERAARCNDRGRARGPWQMRSTLREACNESPHTWEAGGCFIAALKRAEVSARQLCGARDKATATAIALKRAGAGPGTREQPQCAPSPYAGQALRLLRYLRSQAQ